jgi:hypothetical protein
MERIQHNVSAASAGTSPHSRPPAPLTLVLALAAAVLLAGCAANQQMVARLERKSLLKKITGHRPRDRPQTR